MITIFLSLIFPIMIGIILIIVVPFLILLLFISYFFPKKSLGLSMMFFGFLLMTIGFFFVYLLAITFPEHFIIKVVPKTSHLEFQFFLMDALLYSIPTAWILTSIYIIWEGQSKYMRRRK